MPGAQNPFENAGLDKALVEALLLSDKQAITIAVNGLRRAITKALHPDRTDGQQSDYLNDFLQATSRILELSESDQQTLARAYAKQGARRAAAPKIESYTSKDLHDGTLLTSIGEMVLDSGESIPSAHNRLMLIRPLNFNNDKPRDFKGEPYAWYPPAASRTYLLRVDGEGQVTSQAFVQASRKTMFNKEAKRQVADVDYKKHLKQISAPVMSLLEPVLSQAPDVFRNETVVLIKNNQTLTVYDSALGSAIGELDVDEATANVLSDGIHMFGVTTGTLHDTYYEQDATSQEQGTQILIAGSVSSDYTKIEHNRIYKDSVALAPMLPARQLADEQLPVFAVMPEMRKHAEKFYSTSVTKDTFANERDADGLQSKGAYALAVTTQGDFVIIGRIVETLNSN